MRSGFSLMEVLIAVTIVGLAMLPIFTTLSSASRGSVDVEKQALAVGLASESMEWVRALGFGGSTAALDSGGASLRLPGKVDVDAGAGEIRVVEEQVQEFTDDTGGVKVDYPPGSTLYSRELVMKFVRDAAGQVRAVQAITTVAWKSQPHGGAERRVQLEQILYGAAR